jgi:hypothetical protein
MKIQYLFSPKIQKEPSIVIGAMFLELFSFIFWLFDRLLGNFPPFFLFLP